MRTLTQGHASPLAIGTLRLLKGVALLIGSLGVVGDNVDRLRGTSMVVAR